MRSGGNLAENAGGPRAFKYGVTRDWALGLEVVTADGTPLSLGKRTVKGVTGYDLAALVVGSEGTLAVITKATLKLLPKPETVVTLLALLPDVHAAGRAVNALLALGIMPRCLELMDGHTLALVRPAVALNIPDAAQRCAAGGARRQRAAQCEAGLERAGNAALEAGALEVLVARHGGEREKLWAARRELSRALRRTARFKLAEDVVVPKSQIPALLEFVRAISRAQRIRHAHLRARGRWQPARELPVERRRARSRACTPPSRPLFRAVVQLRGDHQRGARDRRAQGAVSPLEQSPELIAWQKRVKATFDPRASSTRARSSRDSAPHRAC